MNIISYSGPPVAAHGAERAPVLATQEAPGEVEALLAAPFAGARDLGEQACRRRRHSS
jgi:hypothetical protein